MNRNFYNIKNLCIFDFLLYTSPRSISNLQIIDIPLLQMSPRQDGFKESLKELKKELENSTNSRDNAL